MVAQNKHHRIIFFFAPFTNAKAVARRTLAARSSSAHSRRPNTKFHQLPTHKGIPGMRYNVAMRTQAHFKRQQHAPATLTL